MRTYRAPCGDYSVKSCARVVGQTAVAAGQGFAPPLKGYTLGGLSMPGASAGSGSPASCTP